MGDMRQFILRTYVRLYIVDNLQHIVHGLGLGNRMLSNHGRQLHVNDLPVATFTWMELHASYAEKPIQIDRIAGPLGTVKGILSSLRLAPRLEPYPKANYHLLNSRRPVQAIWPGY